MPPLPEPLQSLPLGTFLSLPAVNFAGVSANLIEKLAHLAMIHRLTFGKPLVITSANDGAHSATSLHALGRAVDIRTTDKDPDEVALFVHYLAYMASAVQIAYFDERQLAGEPHLHLEWHGQ
jgi:Hedgehog amino-terminal signalling domain